MSAIIRQMTKDNLLMAASFSPRRRLSPSGWVGHMPFSVDTWQGAAYFGQYADEVFVKVNEHPQEHYGGFVQLLQMTFDEAAIRFANNAVELLHVDGCHTYGAIHHGFHTWPPQLALEAAVMFHDTTVRDGSFGAWKLWEELQT